MARDPTGILVVTSSLFVLALQTAMFCAILWVASAIHWTILLVVAAVLSAFGLMTQLLARLFGEGRSTLKRWLGSHGQALESHHDGWLGIIGFALLAPLTSLSFAGPILVEQGWVDFVANTSSPDTAGFAWYWSWILLDMIPILDLWSSFDVEAPLTAADLGAQGMGFAYRVLVVAGAIGLATRWYQARQQRFDYDSEAGASPAPRPRGPP